VAGAAPASLEAAGEAGACCRQERAAGALRAAPLCCRLVNGGGYHLAVIQHEFGLFGGVQGAHAVCFARMLQVRSLAAARPGAQ
jgi:hypothetical protein